MNQFKSSLINFVMDLQTMTCMYIDVKIDKL